MGWFSNKSTIDPNDGDRINVNGNYVTIVSDIPHSYNTIQIEKYNGDNYYILKCSNGNLVAVNQNKFM